MSYEETLKELLNKFTYAEQQITNNPQNEETVEERKNNIIAAYNEIIRHTHPIWESTDNNAKAHLREILVDVYNRIRESLKIIKVDVKLPPTLTEEIKLNETANSTENKSTEQKEEETKNPSDEILQSRLTYDKDTFRDLLDTFDDWDRKITRKNASKNDDVVEQRTTEIINAYNNIIDFAKPILSEQKDNKATRKIRKELQNRNEYIIDDLKILGSDIEVPSDITQKIIIKTDNDNDNIKPENNNTSNEQSKSIDNKSNKMADVDDIVKLMKHFSSVITSTYKGDPNGLTAFISAIEMANTITPENQQDILIKYIKTKVEGKALEAIPSNATTADDIINALKQKIPPESSKVVLGRFLALRTERNALPKFQKEAEDLADQLRRAYISEGMTETLAENTTIDKTVEMCRLSTKSLQVKSILASKEFKSPKEVLAKLVTETATESNEAQVLYYNKRYTQNKQNFRGNFRRNNFNNKYNNSNENLRQQNNRFGNRNQSYSRGRRNNYRGNGNGRFSNRNNYTRRDVRVIRQENDESPVPQRGQTAAMMNHQE